MRFGFQIHHQSRKFPKADEWQKHFNATNKWFTRADYAQSTDKESNGMRRVVAVVAGSLMMASVAMAATPAAPVLSVVKSKIADGRGEAHGGPILAADGLNMYAAFKAPGNILKMAKSTDGGVTWGGAHTIYTLPADPQLGGTSIDKMSLAVSTDPVTSTKKIVHVVWEVREPAAVPQTCDIYYSYADASNLDVWSPSPALRINGSTSLQDPTIAVAKNGVVFVKGEVIDQNRSGKLYLMTASSYQAGFFTEPALILPVSTTFPLAANAVGPVAGDAEIFADASNNLHLSYPYCANADCSLAGIKYTKLPAGSSTWSTPTPVFPPSTAGSNHSGLVAYDANNIYISTVQNGNLTFFSSANGGSSWTKKVVFTKTATLKTSGYSDITVNASKALTIGGSFENLATNGTLINKDVKIYRSTDNGLTWSTATTVANTGNFMSLGVDGSGKVGIVTRISEDIVDGEEATYFSKEK